jgi:hypothetical protein
MTARISLIPEKRAVIDRAYSNNFFPGFARGYSLSPLRGFNRRRFARHLSIASRFQNPALHTKLAASSVLPVPLYFATSGYRQSGVRIVPP